MHASSARTCLALLQSMPADAVLCLQLAPVGRKGTVLAIDAGIAGLMTMIAPSIGTGLYASVGFPSLGIFGACLTAVLMGLLHAGFVVV